MSSGAFAFVPVLADGFEPWAPIVFVLVMAINAIFSAAKAKKARAEHKARTQGQDEQQRTNEVRERMRRLQEERRRASETPPRTYEEPPPLAEGETAQAEGPQHRPAGTPPLDPFGGRGNVWEELQRQLQERARQVALERQRKLEERRREAAERAGRTFHQPAPAQTQPTGHAVVDVWRKQQEEERRQAEFREQEEDRDAELRRAQAAASMAKEREDHEARRRAEEAGWRGSAHPLLKDLRSPDAVRRAFVLREILGPPVSMKR